MRGKKIILSSLFLLSSLSSGENPTLSTLTTFKIKSSKVLPNFQGEEQSTLNHFKYVIPFKHGVKYDLVQDNVYEIQQVSENSFVVIGSPIDWPTYEGSIK